MKTCPKCQQTYPDDVESCPKDGAQLSDEIRDERECPYCAEKVLRKARVCKHCGRDLKPVTTGDTSLQSQSSAPAQSIPEARKSQPQATWAGTSAGRPTVASNTPWLRAKPEPPSRMKFMLLGGAVLILALAAAWYFLQRERQPGQTAKGNAKVEQALPTAGTVQENPKDGLKYVWIPPGTFMMGCSAGDNGCFDDEKPSHQVTVSKGYWLGQTEVTVGAYKGYVGSAGGKMPPAPTYNRGWANESMPVVGVSWDDAETYCRWAGGRLPTEAEWEYAARGGSTESRYGNPEGIAWHADNSSHRPHEVGLKQANGYGLYDMLGNLWEWVNDWYDEDYYQNSPPQDPTGPSSGEKRVLRGLSWYDSPNLFRVSIRTKANGSGAEWVGSRGLRCAVAGLTTLAPAPVLPQGGQAEVVQKEREGGTGEASESLAFINGRFVASNCTTTLTATWAICTRNEVLSIDGDKLIMTQDFEETKTNGTSDYSRQTQTVAVADLDFDSLIVHDYDYEGATDRVEVGCKNKKRCVSSVTVPNGGGQARQYSNDSMSVGDFSRKDANEVGGYVKRLLALQQGKSVSPVEHQPTEEETVSFMNAHLVPSVEVGAGITAFHRSLTVEGDELIEAEDVVQDGSPGHLVVSVDLKNLDETMVAEDSRIGLVCRASSGSVLPNCFSANTGQSSPDHVILGISNSKEFEKMLKRLIVLHQ